MKEIKKKFLRIFLLLEIIIFFSTYLFSKHGLKAIRKIKKSNMQLESEILILKNEISDLEQQVKEWNNDSFYKEKLAREKLLMAKPKEELYKYR